MNFDPALTTAALAAVGWLCAYVLNGRREDKSRRIKASIEHSAEQLRDFYAPLVSLTEQLDSLASVIDRLNKISSDNKDIRFKFYDEFFLPVHTKIVSIISSKIHLMEGSDVPDSFKKYLEHYAEEKAVLDLIRAGIDVTGVNVANYPPEFYWDIRKDFKTVLRRYESGIREIQSSSFGGSSPRKVDGDTQK